MTLCGGTVPTPAGSKRFFASFFSKKEGYSPFRQMVLNTFLSPGASPKPPE